MNVQALKELRRVVEAVPEGLLHMNVITVRTSCGTAHCALGWVRVDPWFIENTNLAEAGIGTWARIASSIFDLKADEIARLFGSGEYTVIKKDSISKEVVLENIERALSGRELLRYDIIEDILAEEKGEEWKREKA